MRKISRGLEAIVMVLDVLRGYVSVASGLTDMSVQRVRNAAEAALTRSGDAAERSTEQLSSLADDLVKQGETNRDLLIGLIRTEVDRAVGRMGFVREEELAAVRSHVQRLESQLRALQSAAGAGSNVARSAGGAALRTIGAAGKAVPPRPGPGGPERPAEQSPNLSPGEQSAAEAAVPGAVDLPMGGSPTVRAPARQAPGAKVAAKKAATTGARATRVPATKAPPATKASAKKAPAKKAPAKKAPAKKAPGKGAAVKTATASPAPQSPSDGAATDATSGVGADD